MLIKCCRFHTPSKKNDDPGKCSWEREKSGECQGPYCQMTKSCRCGNWKWFPYLAEWRTWQFEGQLGLDGYYRCRRGHEEHCRNCKQDLETPPADCITIVKKRKPRVKKVPQAECHCLVEQMIKDGKATVKSWRAISPKSELCRKFAAFTIAEWIIPGFSDSCSEVGFCPKCGAKLWFDENGEPMQEVRT